MPSATDSSSLLERVFSPVAAAAGGLDRVAESIDRPVSVAPPTQTFALAKSRLRDEILDITGGCLKYLGYPPLAKDSKKIPGLPLAGKLELHRLNLELGSVALLELPQEVLEKTSQQHPPRWNEVLNLLYFLAPYGYRRVYFFSRAEEIHPFYEQQLWTALPFEKVESLPMEQLRLLVDAVQRGDDGGAADQFRRWLELPDLPPLQAETDDAQHAPAVLEMVSETLEGLGEFPLDKILQEAVRKTAAQLAGDQHDFADRVHSIVRLASKEGWLAKPVRLAQAARRDDAKLAALARHLAPKEARRRYKDIERELEKKGLFNDPAVLRDIYNRLSFLEARVCAVELEKEGIGTGFLIGPDLVLTNYHVVQRVFDTPALAQDLTVRFDYKANADNTDLHLGRRVKPRLPKWEEISSPHHPKEKKGEVFEDPLPDHLDFCVIRLAERVGEKAIDDDLGGGERGWIDLSATPVPAKHEPVRILQHPAKGELKETFRSDGILSERHEGWRVLYRTESLPGSSGSPCFTWDLDLFALHHVGDPDYEGFGPHGYQQGVPVAKIYARIQNDRPGLLPPPQGDPDGG